MFSKKPAQQNQAAPSAPKAAKSMGRGNSFSVIGADITIKGDIESTSELHIDGRVIGDLISASLVQGESSVIEGAVQAESARLAGRIEGSITASELVILQTAQVTGDVHYDALTIEQGAEVEGRFAHRAPTQAKKVEVPHTDENPDIDRITVDTMGQDGGDKSTLLLSE